MDLHVPLLVIGALLLVGLAADALGRRTRIPRVTLLILTGVLLGQAGFDLIPAEVSVWYEFLATAALSLVAFTLGGSLTAGTLRAQGRQILSLSLSVVVGSALLVAAGLWAVGLPLELALIFAGIATATDPAATNDVIRQSGQDTAFTRRLAGIVAIDDAWGLIAFGLMLAAARALTGGDGGDAVTFIATEIGGALAVGVLVGLPAAYLTGRLNPGEPTLLEALGVVFVCAGLAIWIGASFLLAGMIAGVIVANVARHHEHAFHELDHIESPFLILFFVLAGATVTLPAVGAVLPLVVAFVLLRVLGRLAGGMIGSCPAGMSGHEGAWTGAAMTPQAGVALGMALVAAEYLPQHAETLVAVTVATTVIFELAGPLLTQAALGRYPGDGPERS